MKRVLTIIVSVIISSFAMAQGHLDFMGIPMGISLSDFKKGLDQNQWIITNFNVYYDENWDGVIRLISKDTSGIFFVEVSTTSKELWHRGDKVIQAEINRQWGKLKLNRLDEDYDSKKAKLVNDARKKREALIEEISKKSVVNHIHIEISPDKKQMIDKVLSNYKKYQVPSDELNEYKFELSYFCSITCKYGTGKVTIIFNED